MNLGELQQMTMLAVARLDAEAYGAAIRDELQAVAGRKVAVPTVYVTLVRLEEQGLVESTEVPGAGGRGGRARRVFRLTPAGWQALDEARVAMSRMWAGVVRP
jgi:DNA-binding PadR family transcriptional regulator